MPFCYSGLSGVWVGGCMQRLTLFLKKKKKKRKTWKFSSLILCIFSTFQEAPSLELGVIGHWDGPLRNRSPSLIPPTAVAHRRCPLGQLGAGLQLSRAAPSAELKSSSMPAGVMGPDRPCHCPTLLLQLFYPRTLLPQKLFPLKILRLQCLNVQAISIRSRLKGEALIWKNIKIKNLN